ncbi:hybrid sensor histidine kinase/response regulator [Marinoscillum furvescens]|uniref:histidine kinase n=1 Tax=Marinoscillum furvescens DSM 4134 TaxID=1122208 RepID=A0A3D9L458_MARFU|nr:PAS domain-containing protein [Marinoscillum furvescens]RED97427.1 PAS domain S-box-containing protein [Marinoscillum furvescens DSM 4134]
MKEINIIYLEDNPDDIFFVKRRLKEAGVNFQLKEIPSGKEFVDELQNIHLFDVVLSDFNLPEFTGEEALWAVRNVSDMPFIFLTGALGEEKAVSLMRKGATDFLLKDHMDAVAKVILRALREYEIKRKEEARERELREKTLTLNTLMESMMDHVSLKDVNSRYLAVNTSYGAFMNADPDELIGKKDHEVVNDPELVKRYEESDRYVLRYQKHIMEEIDMTFDGRRIILETLKTPLINDKGETQGIVCVSRDITAKKEAEEVIYKNELLLDQSETFNQSGSFYLDTASMQMTCSKNFRRILGLDEQSSSEIPFVAFLDKIPVSERDLIEDSLTMAFKFHKELSLEHRLADQYGNVLNLRTQLKADTTTGTNRYVGMVMDVTSDKQVNNAVLQAQENERMKVAEDLHNSLGQKLVALKMYINAFQSKLDDKEMVGKAQTLIADSLDEVRDISRNLSLKIIEHNGLKSCLRHLRDLYQQEFKSELVMDFDDNDVSLENAGHIYRIVEEAMSNTAKYAESNCFKLSVIKEQHYLDIDISDDGVGFDVNALPMGNGLKNIQGRVRKSNGVFFFSSEPGKGTSLKIRIPVREQMETSARVPSGPIT